MSAIGGALDAYVGSLGYLRSMKWGAERIGLHGKPAGEVSEKEAEARTEIGSESREAGARASPPPHRQRRASLGCPCQGGGHDQQLSRVRRPLL